MIMKLIKFKNGERDVYINPDAIVAIEQSTLFGEDRTVIALISGDKEVVSNPLKNVIDIIESEK